MASTFNILQNGKSEDVTWKVINNMSNFPMRIQSFNFYFNNSTTSYITGGGGLGYNDSRTGTTSAYPEMSLVITSANVNGKSTGISYSVNYSPYKYTDYQQGRILEIKINSYT